MRTSFPKQHDGSDKSPEITIETIKIAPRMRTQLLPPFLADDFKCKLLEITCHVVRALFAQRGPNNKRLSKLHAVIIDCLFFKAVFGVTVFDSWRTSYEDTLRPLLSVFLVKSDGEVRKG